MNMRIYDTKEYKKLDNSAKKSINKSINKLQERYSYYKEQNIPISKVFGDDVMVHDIINDKYYVYTCKSDRLQIRLLYTTKLDEIDVISYVIKNRANDISNDKYLTTFQKIADDIDKKEVVYS